MQSRRAFERRLGHPVPWLAYPFGDGTTRESSGSPPGRLRARRNDRIRGRPAARRPGPEPRFKFFDRQGVAGLAAMLGGR